MRVCQYFFHQKNRRLEGLTVLPVIGAYAPIADSLELADRTALFSTSLNPPLENPKRNTHAPCSITNGYMSSKTMAYFSPLFNSIPYQSSFFVLSPNMGILARMLRDNRLTLEPLCISDLDLHKSLLYPGGAL